MKANLNIYFLFHVEKDTICFAKERNKFCSQWISIFSYSKE